MIAQHRKYVRKLYSKGYSIRDIENKMSFRVNNTTIRGRRYSKDGFSRSNIFKVVRNLMPKTKGFQGRCSKTKQKSMADRWGFSSVDSLRRHLISYNILHLMPGSSAKVPGKTDVALGKNDM
tara:strand:+ start:262 stop:627 length:366 start_codon:yes stop_codon:yes gene_type:complete